VLCPDKATSKKQEKKRAKVFHVIYNIIRVFGYG